MKVGDEVAISLHFLSSNFNPLFLSQFLLSAIRFSKVASFQFPLGYFELHSGGLCPTLCLNKRISMPCSNHKLNNCEASMIPSLFVFFYGDVIFVF